MKKANFNSSEWQEYFKGKSPEEIEKIKKLFEEEKEINGRPVTGLKDLFKPKNKLEKEKLNKTTLSTEKAGSFFNQKVGPGLAIFALFIIILILIGLFPPSNYWQNLEKSLKIDNSQIIGYSLTQTEKVSVYPYGRVGLDAKISLYPSDAQAKATLFKITKEFSLSHPKADEINVWLNLWSDNYKGYLAIYRSEWKDRKIKFFNQFFLYDPFK